MNTLTQEPPVLETDESLIKLSATRVKTYLQCARQYRFRYVDEIPSMLTGALAFGQIIHQVLHNLQMWRLTHGEPLNEQVAQYEFARLWEEIISTQNPLFKTPTECDEYAELSRIILAGYVEAHRDKPRQFCWSIRLRSLCKMNKRGANFCCVGLSIEWTKPMMAW